jgi:AhpC/TSA family
VTLSRARAAAKDKEAQVMGRAKRAIITMLLGILLLGSLEAASVPWALALEIGKPAPDFTLPSTTGQDVSLRQFRGQKIALIEFFGAAFAPV